MKFIDAGGVEFACPVTFSGGVTPELSLGNIDSLDISGNVIAAGSGSFGTDLSVGDELTVGGNANIGAGLTVTGSVVADAGLQSNGDFSASGTGTINGAFVCYSGATVGSLTTPGAVTCGSVACATIATSGGIVCGTTLGVTGAITAGSTLAVAGASTLHGTTVIGTLSVSAASTQAAIACTTLAASGAVTCATTLGVTGATTLAAASSTALTASTSLTVTGATVVGLHDYVTFHIPSLTGTGRYWLASPVAGTLVKITSCLEAALTTADAVLTGKIADVAITSGALTLTQSGSAPGDVQSVSPSAANVVIEGSKLNFTVSGSQGAAVGCTLTLKFLRSA